MKKSSTIKRILPPHDAQHLWRVAWTYIRTVIDTAHEPFLVLDEHLQVLSANKTFYRFFKVARKETEGVLIYQLGDGQWNIRGLRKLLEKILPKDTFFTNYEVDHVFPRIGRKVLLLNARRVYSSDNRKPIILVAMEDISKRRELEEMLRKFALSLHEAVAVKTKELESRVRRLEEPRSSR